MQESCPYGSVRGAPSNGCPYRNREMTTIAERSMQDSCSYRGKRHRRAEEIDRRVLLLVSFSPRAREEHSHAVRWPETACDVLETARADFREWSAVREICRRGCRIEERAEASSPRTREGIKTRLHEAPASQPAAMGREITKGEAYGVPALWTH